MKRVIIVGGGIVGLCSAYEAIQRGHQVAVIDRTFGEGCSYGNGGIIVPSHFIPIASPGMLRAGLRMMLNPKSPFGLAGLPDLGVLDWMLKFMASCTSTQVRKSSELLKTLNLQSKAIYAQYVSKFGSEVGYQERGLLMICRTEKAFAEELEVAKAAEALGLSTQVCTQADLKILEPDVSIEGVGGVLFKDDAHLTPPKMMGVLKGLLADKGVSFLTAEVTISPQNLKSLRSVHTAAGEIEGDEFLFCAGIWATDMAKMLGVHLPMLSGRGYGITVPTQDQVWQRPAILVESRIAVTPMTNGTRFVGALELGRPTDRAFSSRLTGMVEAIPQYLPGFSAPIFADQSVWTGHRPCSPDGLPYVGRSSKLNNVIWATGHAMMGMSLGPITGQIVGKILDSEPLEDSLSLLSPDRYGK